MCSWDETEGALVWVGNKKRPGTNVRHCIRQLDRTDNGKYINLLQNQYLYENGSVKGLRPY